MAGLTDLDARVVFFPVRHHSPLCARLVVELARTIRPAAVLVEGPSDYNGHLDQLALEHQPHAVEVIVASDGANALEYLRNGLAELEQVIGEQAQALGQLSARLIGLQYYAETADELGIEDTGIASGAHYLARLFTALGDAVEVSETDTGFNIAQLNPRVVRGLEQRERDLMLQCWPSLWVGAMSARRELLNLNVSRSADGLIWELSKK